MSIERAVEVFKSITGRLDHYEREFGMSSEDFISAFQNGLLPERPEFFDWRLVCTGYENLVSQFGFIRKE